MQSANGHSDSYWLRRRPALWVWLAFVCLLLCAASLRVWQNHQRRARYQAWQQQIAQGQQVGNETRQKMRALWKQHAWPDSLHRSDFEKVLNNGEPLALSRQDERDVAVWTDPISGATFELSFQDDKWMGYRGSSIPKAPPAPTPAVFDKATERIRSLIAGWNRGWGPAAWLVLLALCLALKRRRLLLAQLLLGTALVSFAAWLVAPNYSLTRQGVFSNDMLVLGTLMLVLSVSVMVWTVFEDRRRRRIGLLCPNCEHSLREHVTGMCPECGYRIPQGIQLRIRAAAGLTRS